MRATRAALILLPLLLAGCDRSGSEAAAAREAAADARAQAVGETQGDQAVKDARVDALEARVDALEKQMILLESHAAMAPPPAAALPAPDLPDTPATGTARAGASAAPTPPTRRQPMLPSDEGLEEP